MDRAGIFIICRLFASVSIGKLSFSFLPMSFCIVIMLAVYLKELYPSNSSALSKITVTVSDERFLKYGKKIKLQSWQHINKRKGAINNLNFENFIKSSYSLESMQEGVNMRLHDFFNK